MPNIKSAIKRVTVSEKKAAANKSKKSAIRTTIKKAKASVVLNGSNVYKEYTEGYRSGCC